MYTKPHIYHIAFDIKDTNTQDEYDAIWIAIQSVFDGLRSDNSCIDILKSSYLIYVYKTEAEIMTILKQSIIKNKGNVDNFWCFISSVNNKFEHECLTDEMILIFNQWIQNAAGF